jgi:hypothetical protein
MSTRSDPLTLSREASAMAKPERQGATATPERQTDRPPVWSRVMHEARGQAARLARRAFPWRYY